MPFNTTALTEITPQAYNSQCGTPGFECTSYVQAAINDGLANGRNVYFPIGTYTMGGAIQVDLSQLKSPVPPYGSSFTGITLYGEGAGSQLQLNGTTGPLLKILDASGATSSQYFNFHLRNLRIYSSGALQGGSPPTLVQIGRINCTDTLSGCMFDGLSIGNYPGTSDPPGGPALLLNSVTNSMIEGVFDSSNTSALFLQQVQRCRFFASAAGAYYSSGGQTTNGISMHLGVLPGGGQGNNISNTVISPDIETVIAPGSGYFAAGLDIDPTGSQGNVFLAPYFGSTQMNPAISIYGGSGNRLIGPYFYNFQPSQIRFGLNQVALNAIIVEN